MGLRMFSGQSYLPDPRLLDGPRRWPVCGGWLCPSIEAGPPDGVLRPSQRTYKPQTPVIHGGAKLSQNWTAEGGPEAREQEW